MYESSLGSTFLVVVVKDRRILPPLRRGGVDVENDHESCIGQGLNSLVKDLEGRQHEEIWIRCQHSIRQRGMEWNRRVVQGLFDGERETNTVKSHVNDATVGEVRSNKEGGISGGRYDKPKQQQTRCSLAPLQQTLPHCQPRPSSSHLTKSSIV